MPPVSGLCNFHSFKHFQQNWKPQLQVLFYKEYIWLQVWSLRSRKSYFLHFGHFFEKDSIYFFEVFSLSLSIKLIHSCIFSHDKGKCSS